MNTPPFFTMSVMTAVCNHVVLASKSDIVDLKTAMLNFTKVVEWRALPAALLAGVIASMHLGAAMSVERQNQLIKQHCAVCHTDSTQNGGLTLQHFDAAKADPSLAAMLLSKLRGGAMSAAALPFEKSDAEALEMAMVAKSAEAQEWTVTREPVTTASIVREVATKNPNQPSRYRLLIVCDAGSLKSSMQLSWAPSPRNGIVKASVDSDSPVSYQVEGTETMGNGSAGTTGHASVMLDRLSWPARTLTISDLFPGETVVFPFEQLSTVRQLFAGCFVPGK